MTKRPDKDRLQEGYKRILWEADEKKVRTIISDDLGFADGSPECEEILKYWREYREAHGWQVS